MQCPKVISHTVDMPGTLLMKLWLLAERHRTLSVLHCVCFALGPGSSILFFECRTSFMRSCITGDMISHPFSFSFGRDSALTKVLITVEGICQLRAPAKPGNVRLPECR